MVVTPDGSVHAFVVINQSAANAFVAQYPKQQVSGYSPDFPDTQLDEYNDAKNFALYNASNAVKNEIAMSYILDKYNIGVILLKKDGNGAFKLLNATKSIDANGNKSYSSNNCN